MRRPPDPASMLPDCPLMMSVYCHWPDLSPCKKHSSQRSFSAPPASGIPQCLAGTSMLRPPDPAGMLANCPLMSPILCLWPDLSPWKKGTSQHSPLGIGNIRKSAMSGGELNVGTIRLTTAPSPLTDSSTRLLFVEFRITWKPNLT